MILVVTGIKDPIFSADDSMPEGGKWERTQERAELVMKESRS